MQDYNRYSYVLNNPLMHTDPSGHSWWTSFRDSFVVPVAQQVVTWAVAAALMSVGVDPMTAYGIGGFTSSLAFGGNADENITSGVMAAATYKIGHSGFSDGQRFFLHSAANAINYAAHGRSPIEGGIVGGVSSISNHVIMGGVDTGDRLGDFVIRTTLSAMVGGSTSAAMGGRFADGAAAGARIMLMNEMGEDVIDFVIGFGDGVSYGKTVDLRDSLGTNESVNMDSSGYQLGESIGNIWGAATLALLGVRVLASTVPKNALINQNRYLRIGPGKISKTAGKSRFNYGAGRDIPMMRIGNKTPSDLNHLDLRILGR